MPTVVADGYCWDGAKIKGRPDELGDALGIQARTGGKALGCSTTPRGIAVARLPGSGSKPKTTSDGTRQAGGKLEEQKPSLLLGPTRPTISVVRPAPGPHRHAGGRRVPDEVGVPKSSRIPKEVLESGARTHGCAVGRAITRGRGHLGSPSPRCLGRARTRTNIGLHGPNAAATWQVHQAGISPDPTVNRASRSSKVVRAPQLRRPRKTPSAVTR